MNAGRWPDPAGLPGSHPPHGDFHRSEENAGYGRSRSRSKERARPRIHIVLKSTPSGAIAAVDDVIVGRTPAFWEGELTGKPREFTFVLPGYAMARYRFVPTTSGVVYGQLERLKVEPPPDAGVAATVQPP